MKDFVIRAFDKINSLQIKETVRATNALEAWNNYLFYKNRSYKDFTNVQVSSAS